MGHLESARAKRSTSNLPLSGAHAMPVLSLSSQAGTPTDAPIHSAPLGISPSPEGRE